uniref:Uncharacterized protein n=1 Tax=Anguilla anguilla TaxID=7936 RepID=A0A0E9PSS4_ANGAN
MYKSSACPVTVAPPSFDKFLRKTEMHDA